jgi:hypothetical protein
MPSPLRPVAALLPLAILLLWPATPSASSGAVPPPPPSPQELRLIEEVANWVGASPDAPGSLRWVPAALADRPTSFEVFRGYHADRARTVLEALPYGRLIHQAAHEASVDALLLAAMVEAESRFDRWAVSPRGAQGLLQLIPATANDFGAGADPFEPSLNLRAGASYLRYLLGLYDGNVVLAVAAYNAGPGNVQRFGGVPPFAETVTYVERVLRRYVEHHRRLWEGTEAQDLLERFALPTSQHHPAPAAPVAL